MLLANMKRKIGRLLQLIENPKFFRLRQKGISIDSFCLLNKPWIFKSNINTVLDIGANVCDFAYLIHELFPKAVIYSFEPLDDCYEKLKIRMEKVKN